MEKKQSLKSAINNEIDAEFQRALQLHVQGKLIEAQLIYEALLKQKPDHVDCLINLGILALQDNKFELAIDFFGKAIAIDPHSASAYNNRAGALFNLKRLPEALDDYDKALTIKPDYAAAYYNRGNILYDLNRMEEALASYDKAIALKPDYAEAYNNRGNVLKNRRRLKEALANYDKAIALKSDYVEAYNNRGNSLKDLKRLEEMTADYAKVLALNPNFPFVFGTFLGSKTRFCDWKDLDSNLEKLHAGILASRKMAVPFSVLALFDEPRLHKKAAEIYALSKKPTNPGLGPIVKKARSDKIRIGYYSADFHNHATLHLMAGLFEAHDPQKFELFAFSFGPSRQDEMRQRISTTFTKFIEVGDKSNQEIAKLSRELGIDIALDLKGHTSDSRLAIFAERCTPIQVNYLGYPGTIGADYIDYVIADKIVIPEEQQGNYTEKVIYLPHSYQVNDSKREISSRVFTKKEVGLPEEGFVFCCFNNNYKILPETFDIWMTILKKVGSSVLWLFEDNPKAAENLKKEAAARNIDPNRLIFAKKMPLKEHLARHRLADLSLDTLPCNAHTTASDALWAGLPILTRMGQSFASRVAASLLHAIGLPELIAQSPEDYIEKAVELALNKEKFLGLKQKLERNRLTSPLFDTKLFTKHIEMAYETIYERYHAGLKPESINIQESID